MLYKIGYCFSMKILQYSSQMMVQVVCLNNRIVVECRLHNTIMPSVADSGLKIAKAEKIF